MQRRATKIEWTATAVGHLDSIHSFIARDSLGNADRFIQRIRKSVERLARSPHMGEVLAADDDGVLREIYVKNYRIIFRLRERQIRIIAIIHGAQDYDRFKDFLERKV